MSRSFLMTALCAFLLTGCGESSETDQPRAATQPGRAPAPARQPAPRDDAGDAAGPALIAPAAPQAYPDLAESATGQTQESRPRAEASDEPAPSSPAADAPAERLELDDISLTVPKGWQRQKPRSRIVLAEFTIPRAKSDAADGRLTITSAGGSVEDNIARWRKQFAPPEKDTTDEIEVAGLKITLADLSGTYRPPPFAKEDSGPGYRLLGAIVPMRGNQYFLKLVGPQSTVAAHADDFQLFVRSLQKR